MQELPRGARRYLALLHLACIALLAYQIALPLRHGLPTHLDLNLLASLAVFIGLSYLTERTVLQIRGDVWQNLATASQIATILLFAPPIPMLIALTAAFVTKAWNRKVAPIKRAFNIIHPALNVGLTGLLCSLIIQPATILHEGLLRALPILSLLLILFYLLDVGKMLILFALLGNGSPLRIWSRNYRHTLLPELAVGTIGFLGAIAWSYDPPAIVLLVLPLVALKSAFSANTRAEQQAEVLRKRGGQLETVLAVGQHLRLQQNQGDLLQAVAEAARSITKTQVVTGYLRDDEDPELLRRVALAPPDATETGPAHLAVADCTASTTAGEVRIPIELDGADVAGLLLFTGVPEGSANDSDVLAILANQTAIALQNAHLHERALALAARDSLTNLLNRRAAQSRLEEEVARAARSGQALCLLMVDLDDFAIINNTYGHHAGDVALRMVAQALSSSVRAMDVSARYGGDEFVVLLPETDLEQGLASAERIGEAIAALQVIDGTTSVTTGASIGVAAFPEHGRTPEELLRSADQAAYAAKNAGKGRVARPEDATLALDRDPLVLAAQLEHANMATVAALAAAVDAKDPYTQGHSQRVSHYAVALAEALGLPPQDVARIQLAGQLHDVGKIGVPDAILTKAGRLAPDEYLAIQDHPAIGERMLAGVPFLREILPAVRHHHERWDGQGYPDGLRGGEIPRDAAILAVADSFDAMTSSRTYRSALPLAEARRRIVEGSGTQFDPDAVRAFERALAEGEITVLAVAWPIVLREAVEQAS